MLPGVLSLFGPPQSGTALKLQEYQNPISLARTVSVNLVKKNVVKARFLRGFNTVRGIFSHIYRDTLTNGYEYE